MQIHQTTLLDVQDQTLSLLKTSSNLISEVINNKNVHVSNGIVNEKYLDTAYSTLKNEYQKAENLEMVIAVVGTMKAGKSSTINAIVGHEVLPNRNYPMTALPTVVRHVKGKKTPYLSFSNNLPVITLSKEVAKKIDALTSEEINEFKFIHHAEVRSLRTQLADFGQLDFKDEYEGQEEIFSFLKDLNDLMRVAKELDIEPPYEEYSLMDDLPTIEVEFHHLNEEMSNQHGKLSIIDTPGPNEYGQSEKLKAIFKDQLQKASAVLLVVDYTQMNSEAGGSVRNEISKIQNSLGDRFYVMLNKFDAKSKNDSSKEETISYFCNNLMGGSVYKDSVFAVSAKRAFLANRALIEISENDKINLKEGWVSEFGEIAFGEYWEEDIENSEQVLRMATKIWERSGFSIPLEKVIDEANSRAAVLSLESALTQLDKISSNLSDGLGSFKVSINEDVDKLKSVIKGIEMDRVAVANIRGQANTLINHQVEKMDKEILGFTKACLKKSEKLTDDFLKTGEIKQADKMIGATKEVSSNSPNSFRSLFGLPAKDEKSKLKKALKEDGVIVFEKNEKKEAQELIKSINSSLKEIQKKSFSEIKTYINKSIDNSTSEINESVYPILQDTIDKAKEKLGETGLSLSISVASLKSNTSGRFESTVKSAINSTTVERTFSRVRNSFTNFFNDNWGREDYKRDIDVYKVNIADVKKKSKLAMTESVKSISKISTEYFNQEVRPNIDNHIEGITNYLEKYRQTLLAGMEVQKQSKTEKEEIVKILVTYLNTIEKVKEDSFDSKGELDLVDAVVTQQ